MKFRTLVVPLVKATPMSSGFDTAWNGQATRANWIGVVEPKSLWDAATMR